MWKPHWERSDSENCDLLTLRANHPFVELHKPRFLARGGEHIVYRSDANPAHVVKVDTEWIHSFPKRLNYEKELLAAREVKQSAWDDLALYFGHEATLGTQVTIGTFPLSGGIIFEIFQGSQPQLPAEIKTLVLIQRFAPSLQSQEKLSVASGYLEDQADLQPDSYSFFSRVLLCDEQKNFDQSQFIALYGQRGLGTVLSKAANSREIRACLCDCITRACDYSNSTGLTLDLAGQYNVALVPHGDSWMYILPDALAPGSENTLPHAARLLTQFQGGSTLTRKQRYVLMNVLHYVRIINGISMACGLSSRVTLPGVELAALATHFPKLLCEIRARKDVI